MTTDPTNTDLNGSRSDAGEWPPLLTALVVGLKNRGCLNDARTEAAFRAVPRHLFLPGTPVDLVYKDAAIPTKQIGDKPLSSSSQASNELVSEKPNIKLVIAW